MPLFIPKGSFEIYDRQRRDITRVGFISIVRAGVVVCLIKKFFQGKFEDDGRYLHVRQFVSLDKARVYIKKMYGQMENLK